LDRLNIANILMKKERRFDMINVFFLSLLIFVASFVATLAGFGSSTIIIPILSLFLPLPIVLFFTAIIHFIVSLWRFLLSNKTVNWPLVFYFGLTGSVTSFIAGLFVTVRPEFIVHVLGAFLIWYAFYIIINPQFKIKMNPLVVVTGGAISGFLAGVIGIRGAIKTSFLAAFHLPARVHIATIAVIALMVDISRLTAYWIGGVRLSSHLLLILLFMIPVAFAGVNVAYYFVDRISQRHFRKIVGAFLLIVGIKFLIWGTR